MSKRIVYCADGTWNTPESKTNVYRFFKAIPNTASQVAYYDDGVGSDGNPIERLFGGAFGDGLFKKIKDAYTKIAHAYEKDDELFIIGFSRGSYVARSLAGMIAICGLPTDPLDPADTTFVDTVFQAYRNKDRRTELLQSLAGKSLHDAQITMVGVWDTVGSLGIPAIVGGISPIIYGFLDTGLHPDVHHAYHALAIDERRREFPATLWTGTPAQNQTVEQVWFAGVHCDVGGGYPETGLSDITLKWMMGKANALGLEFDPLVFNQYAGLDAKHSLDQIHESWNIGWLFPKHRAIDPSSNLSSSVYIRCEHDAVYAPDNLQLSGDEPAATYTKVSVI